MSRILLPGQFQLLLSISSETLNVTLQAHTHVLGRTSLSLEDVRKASAQVRTALEDPTGSPRSLTSPSRRLSNDLFGPLADDISNCNLLEVSAPPQLLELPLEVLPIRRTPLAVRTSVVWRFPNDGGEAFALRRPASAVIISDITADPERACLSVASEFDLVSYQDDLPRALDMLAAQGRKDVALFSLHGTVPQDGDDYMQVDHNHLLPKHLATIQPRLAYFDSCRMGTSTEFIRALMAMGTQYSVAPFISNEAGDSSTRTMLDFFTNVFRVDTPEAAMFKTRRSLWRLYCNLPSPRRMWKALPFRVYRLD